VGIPVAPLRNAEWLFYFAPDDVFVVAPVGQAIHFSVRVVVEEDPAFDAFAEEEIGRFGEQLLLFAFAFDE